MGGVVVLFCYLFVVQYWSLLVIGQSQVLVFRWKPLGEFSQINIPWDQEFSGGPMS